MSMQELDSAQNESKTSTKGGRCSYQVQVADVEEFFATMETQVPDGHRIITTSSNNDIGPYTAMADRTYFT